MKFLDRLTGQATELPAHPVPGRYTAICALETEGGRRLDPGRLLLDDGSGVYRWDGGKREFAKLLRDTDRLAGEELTADAVRAIAEESRLDNLPSPLLPAEVASQSELLPIEKSLDEVLDKGHLHAISLRPRIDVRYEEFVVDIGRARRTAKGALTHLASHSDCWQRKTPYGIEPRRILGRFSEDDHSIYENRLYARLLDALEIHLTTRIAKVRGLKEQLEASLEFQESEWSHHRLRHRVCKLWGESFRSDSASDNLRVSRATFDILVRQLKAIRGLKQQGLYAAVPRSSQVGGQVHRTNILNHDPHYRHLPPLWELLREKRANTQLRPEDVLARVTQDHEDYSEYVGLTLRRALEMFNPEARPEGFVFHWPRGNGKATRDGADWLLEVEDRDEKLRIVPLFWFGELDADGTIPAGTIVCTPDAPMDSPSWRVRISPMELYVVERLGRILNRWLLMGPASRYGQPIDRIPTPVANLLHDWPEAQSKSQHAFVLTGKLSKSQKDKLFAELHRSASPELVNAFQAAVRGVDALAICPSCGIDGLLKPQSDASFHARCDSCKCQWEIKTMGGQRLFVQMPDGTPGKTDNFSWAGRDWDEFELSELKSSGRQSDRDCTRY